MIPGWLMVMHLFVLAIVLMATVVPNEAMIAGQNDWLWMFMIAYGVISLVVHLWISLRHKWRNTLVYPVLQASHLEAKSIRRWHIVPILGRLSLGLSLGQHINTTIEREMMMILMSYNDIDFLKMQVRWPIIITGLIVLLISPFVEKRLLKVLTYVSQAMEPHRYTRIRQMCLQVCWGLLFIGLIVLAQNRLYSGSELGYARAESLMRQTSSFQTIARP